MLSDIIISQGSAAMLLRCGADLYCKFPNECLSVTVKELRKSVNIWRSYGQQFGVLFFLTHGV